MSLMNGVETTTRGAMKEINLPVATQPRRQSRGLTPLFRRGQLCVRFIATSCILIKSAFPQNMLYIRVCQFSDIRICQSGNLSEESKMLPIDPGPPNRRTPPSHLSTENKEIENTKKQLRLVAAIAAGYRYLSEGVRVLGRAYSTYDDRGIQ
jgi:hypothetical protein